MKFKDKVAIITGSTRGIGKAAATLFASEGAKIVINNHESNEEARATLAELQNSGADVIYIEADVSNEDAVKAMMDQAAQHFGRIDILVNNAGFVVDIPFSERTTEQWKRTLDVNLNGVYYCTKHAIPYLKKQGGVIVNTASTNGVDTYYPTSADYDITKAGVILFTKTMAQELAPNIRVNAVNPGWIDTQMNADFPPEEFAVEVARIGLGRIGKPEEVAKAMLFLASDDASYISGTTLTVDGAYH